MKLDELQDFLDTAQIPVFKKKPKTFLEIARQFRQMYFNEKLIKKQANEF